MTALSAAKPRDYVEPWPETFAVLPVAASTKIYEGAALTIDGSGYAVNLTGASGFIGFAMHDCDNSAGAAGAKTVKVKKTGCIVVTIGDTIALTDHGGTIEMSDNDTFRLAASITGCPVGVIHQVDTVGASGTNRVQLDFQADSRRSL